jgi:hypothetical protein
VEALRGSRRGTQLSAAYIAVCFVLSALAFVPQYTSEVFVVALFVLMLPISPTAFFITYIGGVIAFGPGDWPTWARVAEALVWTSLAAVQAIAVLALCRTRRKRASA